MEQVKSESKHYTDMVDTTKSSKTKTLPKDGQVMAAILKDMGVQDFEPKVINQLLEFSYRYTTNVLEEAKIVSNHAKKKSLDLEDVKMAVELYTENHLSVPPSREILLDMARQKNSAPLPIPKTSCGLRLPPDRQCLTAVNYRLKCKPKQKPPSSSYEGYQQVHGFQMMNKPMIQITPQINPPSQQQPMFKISVNPPASLPRKFEG